MLLDVVVAVAELGDVTLDTAGSRCWVPPLGSFEVSLCASSKVAAEFCFAGKFGETGLRSNVVGGCNAIGDLWW